MQKPTKKTTKKLREFARKTAVLWEVGVLIAASVILFGEAVEYYEMFLSVSLMIFAVYKLTTSLS